MSVKTVYTCQNCGYQSPKWLGRCPDCAKWNSLIEENAGFESPQGFYSTREITQTIPPQKLSDIKAEQFLRSSTKIGELDRVLGGGLVKGSIVLIGGEPGIGKSTLMLQASSIISSSEKVLYISGEESIRQTKLRADRLGISSDNLYLINETNLDRILDCIKDIKPYLVIVDSIQIVYNPAFAQSAGTVTQIKESAGALTALGKSLGISIFIIGHITKEGYIAGPKILEHMVDSVIYIEGERQSAMRILRSIKNRFGPTDEVGIFSMGPKGLIEVSDPSGILISHNRQKASPGASITASIEGTRPLLVEIQALVSHTGLGMPRQRSMGFDFNRMILLAAVMEKNLGLNLANYDIFLNVVGGIRLNEPASDLAASVSMVSSFRDKPVRQDSIIVGEVGLTSEVRSVPHMPQRINEAKRLGFKRCIMPKPDIADFSKVHGIDIIGVESVRDALEHVLI